MCVYMYFMSVCRDKIHRHNESAREGNSTKLAVSTVGAIAPYYRWQSAICRENRCRDGTVNVRRKLVARPPIGDLANPATCYARKKYFETERMMDDCTFVRSSGCTGVIVAAGIAESPPTRVALQARWLFTVLPISLSETREIFFSPVLFFRQ